MALVTDLDGVLTLDVVYFQSCEVLILFCCVFSLTCSDRFRTAVNVLGDSFGAGIVEHLSRHDLKLMEAESSSQLPTQGQYHSLDTPRETASSNPALTNSTEQPRTVESCLGNGGGSPLVTKVNP